MWRVLSVASLADHYPATLPTSTAWRSPRRPALVVRLWLVVLCGYLAPGATLQVLSGFLTHRYSTGPVLIVLVISVAWLAAAALQARRRCQRN